MSFLITGAFGFVGRVAASYFGEMYPNDTIICADVVVPKVGAGGPIDACELDLTSYCAVESLIRKYCPSRVLHLAGKSSVAASIEQPADTINTNVCALTNLLEAIRVNNLKSRIIVVSSSDIYGRSENNGLRIEADLPNPGSPYAASKLASEIISRQFSLHYGMDIIIARPFNHTGAGQPDNFVLPSFAKKLIGIKYAGGPFEVKTGDVSVSRDFLDVKDVIRAYHALFERGISGEVYNIASGEAIPLRSIIERMAQFLAIGVEIKEDPALYRKSDMPILVGSNRKIFEQTGWRREIPLDSTLKEMLQYWEKSLFGEKE